MDRAKVRNRYRLTRPDVQGQSDMEMVEGDG